jgi:hypothetical protein
MSKVNPALFNPLRRIEDAARRAAGILLTTAKAPRECELVNQEISEIRGALDEFQAAVDRGETVGEITGSLRA